MGERVINVSHTFVISEAATGVVLVIIRDEGVARGPMQEMRIPV